MKRWLAASAVVFLVLPSLALAVSVDDKSLILRQIQISYNHAHNIRDSGSVDNVIGPKDGALKKEIEDKLRGKKVEWLYKAPTFKDLPKGVIEVSGPFYDDVPNPPKDAKPAGTMNFKFQKDGGAWKMKDFSYSAIKEQPLNVAAQAAVAAGHAVVSAVGWPVKAVSGLAAKGGWSFWLVLVPVLCMLAVYFGVRRFKRRPSPQPRPAFDPPGPIDLPSPLMAANPSTVLRPPSSGLEARGPEVQRSTQAVVPSSPPITPTSVVRPPSSDSNPFAPPPIPDSNIIDLRPKDEDPARPS